MPCRSVGAGEDLQTQIKPGAAGAAFLQKIFCYRRDRKVSPGAVCVCAQTRASKRSGLIRRNRLCSADRIRTDRRRPR